MFSTIRNIMAFIAIIVILLVWLIQDKRKASNIIIAYAILALFFVADNLFFLQNPFSLGSAVSRALITI